MGRGAMAGTYPSVGGAVAEGLNTGMQQYMAVQDQQDRAADRADMRAQRQQDLQWRQEDREIAAEQRQFDRGRLATQDARQQRLDDQTEIDRTLNTAQLEQQQAHAAVTAAAEAAQGNVNAIPMAVRFRAKQANDAFAAALQARRDGVRKPYMDEGRADAARVAAGKVSLEQLGPDRMVRMLTAGGLNPRDFIVDAVGRSAALAHVDDFEAGMATQNNDLLMKAANYVLGDQVRQGVGAAGRGGLKIASKTIARFAPHPDPKAAAQGFVVPLLSVTVRGPRGEDISYLAPATQGRGAGDNAAPIVLNIADLMDKGRNFASLATTLSAPEAQRILKQGIDGKAGTESDQMRMTDEDWATQMALLGFKPERQKLSTRTMDLGGTVEEITFDQYGREVGRSSRRKSAAPQAPRPPSDQDKLLGMMTPEQRKAWVQGQVDASTAKGKGDLGKPLNEGQSKALNFGTRMAIASAGIEDLIGKGTPREAIGDRLTSQMGGVSGAVAGMLTSTVSSDDQKRFSQYKRDFINASLRRESGAAIAANEFESADRQYFPQPGDTPEVIEQKRVNRETQYRALQAELGGTRGEVLWEGLVDDGMKGNKIGPYGGVQKTTKPRQQEVEGRGVVEPSVDLGPSRTPGRAPMRPAAPSVGTVQQGYRFKGGDPASPASWERVQ